MLRMYRVEHDDNLLGRLARRGAETPPRAEQAGVRNATFTTARPTLKEAHTKNSTYYNVPPVQPVRQSKGQRLRGHPAPLRASYSIGGVSESVSDGQRSFLFLFLFFED